MRLAILFGASTANDFLAASLTLGRAAFLVREEQPIWSPVSRVIRRQRPWPSKVDQLAFMTWYAARHHRTVEASLRAHLGEMVPPVDVRTPDINSALESVRQWQPDLVLVFGTSMLSDTWNSLGVPIVNVHTGLVPDYRGRFCWLWPVLEGRSKDVGVTLHLVTRRVDAGAVVLQRRVESTRHGSQSFDELLEAVTRLSLELCEELLSEPSRLIAAARPSQASARPAYLEPGLSDYLRSMRRNTVS